MQAIIRTGGKQYRVAEGDILEVEKIDAEPGSEVDLDTLMVYSGADVSSDGGSVRARIVEDLRARKITVFKYKSKTGYRRKQGHRQNLTRIEVTSIAKGA